MSTRPPDTVFVRLSPDLAWRLWWASTSGSGPMGRTDGKRPELVRELLDAHLPPAPARPDPNQLSLGDG